MKKSTERIIILSILWTCALLAHAQITGVVVDNATGDTIQFPSAVYKGNHVMASGDEHGRFTIDRHNGWYLTVSALGYKPQRIMIRANTPGDMVIRLKSDTKNLDEVVVKSKRKSKYSRKNNPAVELMKRVIEAKKRTDLANHDFYQYNKYQKITLAVNDISPDELENAQKRKQQWLLEQVEICPYNGKLILPISVDETVTQHLYRRDPRSEKDIVKGQSSTGVNQLIETGNILNSMLKDVFTDVDIYDDQVRLLQYPFTSPIGKDAIGFYRFYIEDTVFVGQDRCIHLQFTPNNIQDFGFRGELYVINDSSLHVKKCSLTIPSRSDVNFVENLRVDQEYTKLSNGEWVLSVDDMIVEMALTQFLSKAIVIRTTRLSDYAFDPLPKKLFKGRATTRYEAEAKMRDEKFWQQYRTVELSKSESSMDAFIHRMEQTKGFKYILFGIKALIENFVETGTQNSKSKFDIGPINTIVSNNFVDGLRFRASGQTTAALNPHWFWKGYYAYGVKSNRHYYSSTVTYSFNKKEYQPSEFPSRTISLELARDVMSPTDKFLSTDKDNVFTALRWQKVNQMYFYSRQKLKFDWETAGGFQATFDIKRESNEPTGDMEFTRIDDGSRVGKIHTTEMTLAFRFCPGRTYVNTKQHRLPVNFDAPEFTLSHTMGFDGFLGGEYKYNYTELGVFKRFWLNSWGKMDLRVKGGAQWNKVPYPLLIMPPANLSYVLDEGTFALMGNMEFLNDRFAMVDIMWDLNGKLLNRVPLIKKLKLREIIGIKGMMGHLTSKNNPFLEQNANDPVLFNFPEGTRLMENDKPYLELVVGVHNIFRFFQVAYVRRLTYTDLPGVKKNGVRFGFQFTF